MINWILSGTQADNNGNGTWYYYKCPGNFNGFWSDQNYQAQMNYNKTIHIDKQGKVVDNDSHITAHIKMHNKGNQQVSNHAVSYHYLTGTFTTMPAFFPVGLQTYITQSLQALAAIN